MAENVFALKEAGDAVNPNFISVNMQMEVTEKAPDIVKTACENARSMMSKYNIHAFPAFLFFTPDGKLVHRVVGPADVTQFISFTRDALEPAKQYYSMVDQYYQGRRDTLLLESLAISAFQIGDRGLGDSVVDERPDFAETIVTNAIIRQNSMILDLFNDHSPKQSWDKIYNDLNINYGPAYAHRVIVWIKVCYYKRQTNWELYLQSLLIYLRE
jgi:hypothetical protein